MTGREGATNVALVGTGSDVGRLSDVVAARNGRVVSVPEADVVVALGESALIELASDGIDAPVIPVAPGDGSHVVAKPDAEAALASVLEGTARRITHQRLRVAVDGEPVATALYDVTLVTTDPARISEYVVVDGERTLASVRSDGVVVATPLGSAGYARAAGGPVLSPDAGLAVVPIAPFTTHPEAWVVDEGIDVEVVRDDEVTLLADDGAVCEVGLEETVGIRRGKPIHLLSP